MVELDRLEDVAGVGWEMVAAVEVGETGTADGGIAVEIAITRPGYVNVVDCMD